MNPSPAPAAAYSLMQEGHTGGANRQVGTGTGIRRRNQEAQHHASVSHHGGVKKKMEDHYGHVSHPQLKKDKDTLV